MPRPPCPHLGQQDVANLQRQAYGRDLHGVADLDVGENIGAKLQVDQAEADMRRWTLTDVPIQASLRQAIGMPQTPPNQVLIGLALFLSFFVMAPVLNQVYDDGIVPYMEGTLPLDEAAGRVLVFDAKSKFDVPGFNRVMVDGFADIVDSSKKRDRTGIHTQMFLQSIR